MYTMAMTAQEKPDILWILTDDHRADALECFNIATRGTKESRLGYVRRRHLTSLPLKVYCLLLRIATVRVAPHREHPCIQVCILITEVYTDLNIFMFIRI